MTNYKKEMCDELIKTMSKGASISQFCADNGIARSTFYDWVAAHPELKEAHAKALDACQAWWEDKMITGMIGNESELKKLGTKGINLGPAYFTLKTRFHRDYSEKSQVETNNTINLNYKLDDSNKS